jgi:hypothetical protein
MAFYLGCHQPSWLDHIDAPLFIARQRLYNRAGRLRRLDSIATNWAVDSGGFTELAKHGHWFNVDPAAYAQFVVDVDQAANVRPDWFAPQDWMCEPEMTAKTGLTVDFHQQLTVNNLLELRALLGDQGHRVIPVLQGWTLGQYWRHVEQYRRAGVDLTLEPVVGLGSTCRRENPVRTAVNAVALAAEGLHLHLFGVKGDALALASGRPWQWQSGSIASADSLAWSMAARYDDRLPECTHRGVKCQNCPAYALAWRARLLANIDAARHEAQHEDAVGTARCATAHDQLALFGAPS